MDFYCASDSKTLTPFDARGRSPHVLWRYRPSDV
jgi:hypothetical protein